ncbi:hypothetical protein [Microbulbifer agarilyticus]
MRNNSETFDLYNSAPQRALRLVVVIEFPTPVYLASHGDIPGLPAGALGGVLGKVSSTSQRLQPEAGRAEIGAISFELVDVGGVFTDTLRNQLQAGHGIKGRTVRLYQGGAGMDWADFRLEQTQVAEESLGYDHGRYRVRCRDIQREMRKDIFVPRSTRLATNFAKGASTLSVYSTADFEPCPHTASFGDAPGQTVYYLKIKYQNGWEVVRATGKTATTFTGLTRGLFGTVEYDHTVPAENDDDKGIEVEEFIYLELPGPALAYALLTGNILGTSDVLPSNWHLGIDPALVVADEFENVGADWYKPGDYSKGVILRFDGLAKTDGKKFIEQEINLLLGAYMPVNAAGQLGFRRMTGVLADAGTVATITADDVVSLGELQQDLAALRNIFSIQWAWYEAPGFDGRFLRSNVLADADSIAHHGESKPQALKFKGLHNSRHTFTTLKNRFDALRDRFAGPPLRLRLSLLPSTNDIEVGDVVRVTLPQVRDYTNSSTLDRAMEVQRVSVDQTSGAVQVELFGSTQAAAPITDEDAGTNAELPDGWYSAAGTEMTAAGLSIDGSGFLTADGTLDGAASSRTVFYYLGDLTIPAGRTLFVADNVELRVMGVLQIEGTLRGVPSNGGVGFLGSCRGGAGRAVGKSGPTGWVDTRGRVVTGRNAVMPALTIDNDGGDLVGIPDDLRGSGGARGGNSYYYLRGDLSYEPAGFGGSGGQGGAGVVVVARGIALGVSGSINTSGGDGQPGNANGPLYSVPAGSGGGGAPGGALLIVDGHQNPQPVLTNSKLVACYGDSPSSPGNAGEGGRCLGVNAARVYTVPKSRTPYPNYSQDPEIDPAVQQAIADAQQAAQDAAAAQSDASSALAKLDDIGADGKLHPSEKLRAQLEYSRLTGEQAGIEASATAFAITTEKTAYSNAVAALTSYLGGLSPNWNDTSATTTISRTLWNSNWQAVYDARQVLLNAISDEAGARADWAQIDGPGKPEDNATYGATAAQLQQIADAEQAAASAQVDASEALADLIDVAADNKLHPAEKKQAVPLYDDIIADRLVIEAQANAFGITTERNEYTATVNNLTSHLATLSPAWNDFTSSTTINRNLWKTRWSDVYQTKQVLLNKIAELAGQRANWSSLTDDDGELSVVRSGSGVGFFNGCDGGHLALWIGASDPDGTSETSSDSYSGGGSLLIKGTGSSADSSGNTSVPAIEIPEAIALQFGGRRVRVSLYAKTPTSNASAEFAVAYSTADNGNSGWSYFVPGSSWTRYDMVYDVPNPASGGTDFVGVWGDTSGSGKGVLIDSVQVEVIPKEADLDALNLGNAASIRNDSITQEQVKTAAGWATLPASGANYTSDGHIDSRANARIGTLRPDSNYLNSNTTKSQVGLGNVNNFFVDNAVIDGRANSRIGALRPDSAYKNSNLSANDVKQNFVLQYVGGRGANLLHPAYSRFLGYTLPPIGTTIRVDASLVSVGTSPIGGTALQIKCNNASSWCGIALRPAADKGTFHVESGKTYIVSCWVNTLAVSQSWRPELYLADGTPAAPYPSPKSTGAATFIRESFEITANDTGEAYIQISVTSGSMAVNDIMRFDGFMVEEKVGDQAAPSALPNTGASYIDPYTGQPFDQRGLPMLNSDLSSVALSAVCSARDAGSTATIDIDAHTVQFGNFSVNYSSASISGLDFSKKYYIYCDDPGYAGGAVSYFATTNWATAQAGIHRRLVDYLTTPANGGSSSGGGTLPPEDCVATGMWLLDGLRVDDALADDVIDVWDIGDTDAHAGAIEAIRPAVDVPCVRITTESGARVECSVSTPVTGPDGAVRRAPAALGMLLGVLHGDAPLVWERVTRVEPIGPRTVYHLSCGNISFAAGADAAHRVVTHNIRYKP